MMLRPLAVGFLTLFLSAPALAEDAKCWVAGVVKVLIPADFRRPDREAWNGETLRLVGTFQTGSRSSTQVVWKYRFQPDEEHGYIQEIRFPEGTAAKQMEKILRDGVYSVRNDRVGELPIVKSEFTHFVTKKDGACAGNAVFTVRIRGLEMGPEVNSSREKQTGGVSPRNHSEEDPKRSPAK